MARRLLIGLGFWVSTGLGQDWTFPDQDDYIRAGLWQASVIDRYIYLDGGEISQVGDDDFYKSYPMNDTLSIDCTKSWSPEDVEVRQIPRHNERVPVQSKQALLTDHSRGMIYAHGGYFVRPSDIQTDNLWGFRVDDEGGGSWERAAVDNLDDFANSTLSEGTAFASATDGGFIFGGAMGRTNFKGYKTFNFTTMVWEEKWDAPYSPDGSLYGGAAVFVEKYGTAGLVMVMGGTWRRFEDPSGYSSPSTVHFYDVAEQKWHSQQTSGDIPPGWEQGCVVGVDDTSENNSFEIFVYGGANVDLDFPEIGTVYALSLPGFVWTKVSDEEDRYRSNHACVAVGNQLISFGGLDLKGDSTDNWAAKDPYPRGIGIFNLNTHRWEDSYDSDGGEYETHENIKAWYDDGGLDDMDWSDEIRALFAPPESDDEGSDSGSSSGGSNSQNGDENSGSDSSDEDSSSTPVGAIAGGVVGGVAGIALIGAAAWFFLRRRRQSQGPVELEDRAEVAEVPSPDPVKYSPPSMYGGELQSNEPHEVRTELADTRSEPMSSVPMSELDGLEVRR